MNAKAPQYPPKKSRSAAIPPPPPPTKACKNCGKGNMTPEQAIAALEALSLTDALETHIAADEVLLRFLDNNGHLDIAEAYRRVREHTAGFWYV